MQSVVVISCAVVDDGQELGVLQDCGKPWYVENYNSFYQAIKKVYPNITLIANCNMGGGAPTDLWDWHSYDESFTM